MKQSKKTSKHKYILLAILTFAVFLRSMFFIGFGLGDDAYYASTSKSFMESGYKNIYLEFGSNYRISLWVPISFFFKIFGISNVSFVLFPFLASLGLVVVSYLIGKELANEKVGLMAAFFIAINPFDAVFASTMTIDIATDFLLALSLLLFIKGNKNTKNMFIVYYLLAILFLVWTYFIKLPSLFMVSAFVLITLIEIKNIKRHLIFYTILSICFLMLLTADYIISGDFLHYLHQELKYAPRPGLYSSMKNMYFNWMFTGDLSYGILLFGYFFYFEVFGLIYCTIKKLDKVYPLIIWFLVMFFFLNFMPMKVNPYMVPPRFFRYTHAFFVPAIILFAISLDSVWNFVIGKSRKHMPLIKLSFFVVLFAITISSLYYGIKLSNMYKDAFSDTEEAAFFLAGLEPKPIYSDNIMLDRFNFYTGYERTWQVNFNLGLFSFQQDIIEKRNYEPLREISDAYVITGGARAPDIGPYYILSSNYFNKTENWELIKVIERDLTEYRAEYLKIYYVK